MKSFNFKITFARLKRLRRHGCSLVHPAREWALGILIGVFLLVAGGAYAAFIFTNVAARAVDEGQASIGGTGSAYNAREIKRTLESYEVRERRFIELRGDVPPPESASVTEEVGGESEVPADVSDDAVPVAE